MSKRTQTEIQQAHLSRVPKYFCNSCTKCCNHYCSVFNRYVEVDYNKCIYHSNYTAVRVVFKVIPNLEAIMAQEEKLKALQVA